MRRRKSQEATYRGSCDIASKVWIDGVAVGINLINGSWKIYARQITENNRRAPLRVLSGGFGFVAYIGPCLAPARKNMRNTGKFVCFDK